ncbi:hypothetical protein K7640_14890 [Micromonospora sp. PLK6-60]|uniref:hypothetical protein n=1 Tax=Micromonospora sp. PLK6-60 TaxID=2873383 RepID=UPI001CA7AE4B|nr:hypothetical protein [Micromonospora sp. PLK6-60]MBY8873120.1 hypothetical protein [Micromonospora sp. PLK6-60]
MDGSERAEIRRGRLRFQVLMVGAGVLAGALFVLVLALTGGPALVKGSQDPPAWAETAGPVLMVVGLLAEVGVFVWAWRRGLLKANRRSRLWALPWSRRRELTRQVRRGTPAAGEDPVLLRHTAEQMVAARWYPGLLGCLLLMLAGQALSAFSWFMLGTFLAAFACFGAAAVLMTRDARRAEAYLRRDR